MYTRCTGTLRTLLPIHCQLGKGEIVGLLYRSNTQLLRSRAGNWDDLKKLVNSKWYMQDSAYKIMLVCRRLKKVWHDLAPAGGRRHGRCSWGEHTLVSVPKGTFRISWAFLLLAVLSKLLINLQSISTPKANINCKRNLGRHLWPPWI
jgi:hypothetical protein